MGYRQRDDIKLYPKLGHQHFIESQKEKYESQRAEACNRSEALRTLINKKIQDGAPTEEILLMAIECIGLMAGDKVFISQNTARLKNRDRKV